MGPICCDTIFTRSSFSLGKGKAQNLIDYSDDQWSATVGVGRKFNNKWSGSASVGYDSGAGNPVTTLGPTEGYWNVGLGAQYSPAENYFIQAGVKYFWLGDAQAQTGGTIVGDFEDNHAMGYGLKNRLPFLIALKIRFSRRRRYKRPFFITYT